MKGLFVDELIRQALKEDIGTGDITTVATVPTEANACGKFIAKESGIVCGIELVCRVFALLDSRIVFASRLKDGARVEAGDVIAEISGSAAAILTGERTALNFLQHLSGIATKTAECVAATTGTNAKICDTRKTIPGLRALEKYAVKTGGGSNHRFSLADGVLIKDNHIKASGGITAAVNAAKSIAPHTLKIEVETENLAMVQEALDAGADIIMLDNMTLEAMSEAVQLIGGRAKSEASGNMGSKDLAAVALTGVDYISIGALTHSAKALDISLKFS